jgi:hypothetical protein
MHMSFALHDATGLTWLLSLLLIADMDIPLGEGYRDPCLPKRLIYGTVQFMHRNAAYGRLLNPAEQFEVEGRFPEFSEAHHRRRIGKDIFIPASD